ncbi:hypothetical protein R1158_01690 [Citrobacter koseri]|nr:hypothetical protein [Citrobacter koseri]WOI98904.1 hypothetical protein R1158_01690 [Citrobacter koseri]
MSSLSSPLMVRPVAPFITSRSPFCVMSALLPVMVAIVEPAPSTAILPVLSTRALSPSMRTPVAPSAMS